MQCATFFLKFIGIVVLLLSTSVETLGHTKFLHRTGWNTKHTPLKDTGILSVKLEDLLRAGKLRKGDTMPFFSVQDNSNHSFTNTNLKGKVYIINFWFTTCKPCIEEMPSLNEVFEKFASDKNVVFLSFANSNKDDVNNFLKKQPFKFNHITNEVSEKYIKEWGVGIYPSSIIVDKDGIISGVLVGGRPPKGIFAFFEKQIKEALEK